MGHTPAGQQNGAFIAGITRGESDHQRAGTSHPIVTLRLKRLGEPLAVDYILFRGIPVCTENNPVLGFPGKFILPAMGEDMNVCELLACTPFPDIFKTGIRKHSDPFFDERQTIYFRDGTCIVSASPRPVNPGLYGGSQSGNMFDQGNSEVLRVGGYNQHFRLSCGVP
jgi:hypothetical protein